MIWQLAHTMQQQMTQELAELGLNLPQVGALVHIARGDVVSTADLARAVLMTPQNMSLTVAKLEAEGYVTRRPHETHGRIHRIEPTRSGLRVLAKAVAILESVEDRMLRGLSATKRRTLVAQLRLGLDNLKEDAGRKT
ncbi:MAG: MarR family transcriptional regulator [Deltaproteobacteria bacterium]